MLCVSGFLLRETPEASSDSVTLDVHSTLQASRTLLHTDQLRPQVAHDCSFSGTKSNFGRVKLGWWYRSLKHSVQGSCKERWQAAFSSLPLTFTGTIEGTNRNHRNHRNYRNHRSLQPQEGIVRSAEDQLLCKVKQFAAAETEPWYSTCSSDPVGDGKEIHVHHGEEEAACRQCWKV